MLHHQMLKYNMNKYMKRLADRLTDRQTHMYLMYRAPKLYDSFCDRSRYIYIVLMVFCSMLSHSTNVQLTFLSTELNITTWCRLQKSIHYIYFTSNLNNNANTEINKYTSKQTYGMSFPSIVNKYANNKKKIPDFTMSNVSLNIFDHALTPLENELLLPQMDDGKRSLLLCQQ